MRPGSAPGRSPAVPRQPELPTFLSYTAAVQRTFETAARKYFLDPLDDEDLAALSRIWEKLKKTER